MTAERGATQGVWVFQCVEHPGAISQGRRLGEWESLMGETVAFVAGTPVGSFELALEVKLADGIRDLMREARTAIDSLVAAQIQTAEASRRAARALVDDAHLTGAEAAVVLGISPQRVSQLVHS
ncbi:MAG: hypothetical protein WKF57_06745 [Nakamurella sp.]